MGTTIAWRDHLICGENARSNGVAMSLQPIRALPERPSLRTQLTLLPRRVSV